MDWVNLHTSTLDSPEVVGAEPKARATWLFLLRYCVGQENGGLISNCRVWGDRKWQQLVRVTRREVLTNCALWRWEDENLRVNYYPIERQEMVQKKRKEGKEYAAKRWGNRSPKPPKDGSGHGSTDGSPIPNPYAEVEVEVEVEEQTARELGHLPRTLQSPDFGSWWNRWKSHWSDINRGKQMPLQTEHQQLRELASMGQERAIEALRHTIAMGKLSKPVEPFAAKDRRPEPIVETI